MRPWPRHLAVSVSTLLLGGSMLSGCASANFLAALDGPYIPPSQRVAAVTAQPAPIASPEPDAPQLVLSEPETEPEAVAEAIEPEAPQLALAERETAPVALTIPQPEPALADTRAQAEMAEIPVAEPAITEPRFVGPVLPPAEMAQLATRAPEPRPEPEAGADKEVALALPSPEPEAVAEEPVVALALPEPAPEPAAEPEAPAKEELALALPEPAPEPEREPAAVALDLPATLAPEPDSPPPSRIGPDFLPPEPEEEVAELAPAPAPALASAVPVSPLPASPGLVGPVLGAEPPREPLEMRTRSAFDFAPGQPEPIHRRPAPEPEPQRPTPQLITLPPSALPPVAEAAAPSPAPEPAPAPAPAPTLANPRASELERAAEAVGLTVVSALPDPVAGQTASGTLPPGDGNPVYREFFDFALTRLDSLTSGSPRESMLLQDPPSLDPELKGCGNLPPAVLIDLDPGAGLLPLVAPNRASADLVGYLDQLRLRGVTIYWISGHGPGQAGAIRQRLAASGLDPNGTDPLIVTRFAGESKQERRYGLGDTNCLLAIMGDQRGDFDELYDYVLDPIMAAPLEGHIDHGWFLAPPPLG